LHALPRNADGPPRTGAHHLDRRHAAVAAPHEAAEGGRGRRRGAFRRTGGIPQECEPQGRGAGGRAPREGDVHRGAQGAAAGPPLSGRAIQSFKPARTSARERAMDTRTLIEEKTAAPAATKKVFVKTYGCQMNVYDSQRMTDALAAEGYVASETAEDADLVLLNTCHIREKAAEKVYSELGRLRRLKEDRASAGGEMLIGVAGCVAQAEGGEIIRRAKAVDLVIGPQTYHRLPDAIRRVRGGEKVVETDYAVEDKFEHLPAAKPAIVRGRGVTAFLTVQEGCDKFCTFCVVPYTRGSETSRSVAQIVAEAEGLARAGVRELT